jgi:TatD DNase family protein
VVHCFTGERAQLDVYLELGLHIGITGWICDERRGAPLFDAARHIPLDRLLIETDAPYLLPRTLRPKPRSRRNEPMFLCAVRDRVAEALGQEPATIEAASTRNAERLFRLPPHPGDAA